MNPNAIILLVFFAAFGACAGVVLGSVAIGALVGFTVAAGIVAVASIL